MDLDEVQPLLLPNTKNQSSIKLATDPKSKSNQILKSTKPNPENIVSYFPESDFDALNEYMNLISWSPQSKDEEIERRWKLFKLF